MATKLEAARGYILEKYNEGRCFRYDLLSRGGYIKKKLHGGIRGFILKEIDSQSVRQAKIINRILTGADGA